MGRELIIDTGAEEVEEPRVADDGDLERPRFRKFLGYFKRGHAIFWLWSCLPGTSDHIASATSRVWLVAV